MPSSTLAAACDRHGVSDRAAAPIATGVMQDNKGKVIDRSQVRKERHKKSEKLTYDSIFQRFLLDYSIL